MKLRQGFFICNFIFLSGFSFLFAFLLKRKEKEEPALLNSISVIISGFSFCLRRGIPAFAVKLRLCYHLRLFFACGAVLSWAESTQRPPLSWKRAPKEPKTSSPVAHLRYLFPVAAQNSAWSFFLAYAAPRAPSLLELPALFCLRRSIKDSGWRESGGGD